MNYHECYMYNMTLYEYFIHLVLLFLNLCVILVLVLYIMFLLQPHFVHLVLSIYTTNECYNM